MLHSLLWIFRVNTTQFGSLLLVSIFVPLLNAQSGDIRVTVNPDAVDIERIFIIPGDSDGCEGGELTSESVVTLAEMQLGQKYTILERKYLDMVLEEQRLGMSGLVFQSSAVDAGRIQGSQGVVFCSVGCIQSKEVVNLKLVDCQEGVQRWNATGVNADIFKLLATILEEINNAPAQLELRAAHEANQQQKEEEDRVVAELKADSVQRAVERAFDCRHLQHAGITYDLVRIGEDCWFAENLRSDQYANGALITRVGGAQDWKSFAKNNDSSTGAYSAHDQPGASSEFGYLYNLHAAHSSYGLCPAGWKVPSGGDWAELIWDLGGERFAGGKLKSEAVNGNNTSGFSAILGGSRSSSGELEDFGEAGFWWASDLIVKKKGQAIRILLDDLKSTSEDVGAAFGLSIRCMRIPIQNN